MIDLSDYPTQSGIALISAPQAFEGGEELYDQNIGGAQRQDALRCGRGALQLALRYTGRPIATLLEIGAGGGTCSLGLVSGLGQGSGETAGALITDTSPAFLQMIRRKLEAAGLDAPGTRFATLAGEDLGRLPQGSMDAIIIASALHHVGDWRAFLRDAARVLREGGVLVIQEPCREGNLMMGMALDVALSPLWPKSAALDPADARKLQRCRDSIYLLANSQIEKIGEDKHSFSVHELADAADLAGFSRSIFYANAHFQDLADTDLAQRQGRCSFVGYFGSFLEQHHLVSAGGMAKLRQHLFPVLRHLDQSYINGDGAPLFGCMVFRR